MAFQTILIAVDASPYALKAARTGCELARACGATVTLVYVIDTVLELSNIDGGEFPDQARQRERAAGQTLLAELSQNVGAGLTVQTLMPEGKPTELMLAAITDTGADLLVIGTHDRSGLLHLLQGSLTDYALRHSQVPVLVVPTHRST